MPTEVARSAVATKRVSAVAKPKTGPRSSPPANGKTAPRTATCAADTLARVSSRHVGLQAGHEEEQDHSELGDHLEELGVLHHVEQVRAEHGTDEEFADDGGLAEAREDAPHDAGSGEGDEDLEQDVGQRGFLSPAHVTCGIYSMA